MLFASYWRVLVRYRHLILALGGLTIILGALSVLVAPPIFTLVTRVSFTPQVAPEDPSKYFLYDRYYSWLSSEYIVDDYSEIVKSEGFARTVSDLLGGQPDYKQLLGAFTTKKVHRILRVEIAWHNEAEGLRIAKAVDDALVQTAAKYTRDDLHTAGAIVTVVDPPISAGRLSKALAYGLVGLRGLVGFVVGIALAFLLNNLDTRVWQADEVEALGFPVLGSLPVLRPELFQVQRRRPTSGRWARMWGQLSRPVVALLALGLVAVIVISSLWLGLGRPILG